MSDVFGNKLGQYILLEKLGEGGMAKVFNAFDSRAENNVAIKVILPSKRSSQVFLQQFEMEAKALANLAHTNIVKVLNYGVENDQPYIVMEYIPGGTLKEALTKPLPWQTAAAILAPIARALEYVHQQQIVHRDVKPSNILLQDDYRPMLSDFGILKLLETKNENVNSAIGVGVGTPEYMSPEQGLGKEVDFRADIYSLGLVFYEMVTGQKPFTADTPMALVIKHVTDEIPLPTLLNKRIPKFVEQAIMRAVQKDPHKRYRDMGHFADVLELIALGEQAPKKKIATLTRRREKTRLPMAVLLTAFVIFLSASFFAYETLFKPKALPTEVSSGNPGPITITPFASHTPTQKAGATTIMQNTPAPQATSTLSVLPTAGPAPASSEGVTLLGMPLANQTATAKEIARWGIGGVNAIAWAPDGNTIIVGTTSGIFMYTAQGRDLIRFIDAQFAVIVMALNPDGNQIAAGSPTGEVKIWDIQTGQLLRELRYSAPPSTRPMGISSVTAISFSPSGKAIAVGYDNGALNYFSADQSFPSLVAEQHPLVTDLAISGDNRFIYVSNGGKDLHVWDIASKKKIKVLSNPAPVSKLKLSHDRDLLLCAGNGYSVYLWDTLSEKLLNSFPNLGSAPTDFNFSNNSKLVVIGLNNGTLKVFEVPSQTDFSKTLTPITTIEKIYSGQIRSVAFSPTQSIFASGNWEEGLKIWDAPTGKLITALDNSMLGINELYFSKDGNWLVTAHVGGVVRLWDVNKAQPVNEYEGYLPKGYPFSPDNRFLAVPHSRDRYNEAIQIVDLSNQKIVAELPGYVLKSFVQFSDDSKLLVMGDDHAASIWDTATWEQLNTHGAFNAGCGQYFTPQNERLAVISDAGILFSYSQNIIDMCGTKPKGTTFMYYFQPQNLMLFVLGNGNIWIGNNRSYDLHNIETNDPYASPGKIFLAGDYQSGWYAYAANDSVYIKNISNSYSSLTIHGQVDYDYRVAFLPVAKLFALGSHYGSIHIWTLP